MKRSKIIKVLAKNLIRQNERLLEERRQERIEIARSRQAEIDLQALRQINADDRLSGLIRVVGPSLVGWLIGGSDEGDRDPGVKMPASGVVADEVDVAEETPKDADLAVDLLSVLQTISIGQQDQLGQILSSQQKLALRDLAKKAADRVAANAEYNRAQRARSAASAPIGVGDVVVLGSGGPDMVVLSVVGDHAMCSWRVEPDGAMRESFPLACLVLVRRVSTNH